MFPDRLRELRKGRNITLETLAEEMNKHLEPGQKPNTAAQIGNWERGDRSPSYIEVRKLADFSMFQWISWSAVPCQKRLTCHCCSCQVRKSTLTVSH